MIDPEELEAKAKVKAFLCALDAHRKRQQEIISELQKAGGEIRKVQEFLRKVFG